MWIPHGGHTRRVDSTGRFTLPDAIRKLFDSKSFVIAPGFDKTLRIYSPEGWAGFYHGTLAHLDEANPDHGDFLRTIAGMAVEMEVDTMGRLRLTEELAEWVGIDSDHRELQVFAMPTYIEAWEKGRWEEFKHQQQAALKELGRELFGRKRVEARSDEAGS